MPANRAAVTDSIRKRVKIFFSLGFLVRKLLFKFLKNFVNDFFTIFFHGDQKALSEFLKNSRGANRQIP